MSRSLDFTACIKQDECPVKDCWRKLTKEEKDWLEKTPNRMYYADFSDECEKKHKIIEKWEVDKRWGEKDD